MAFNAHHQYDAADAVALGKSTTVGFDDIDTSPYGIVAVTNGYAKLDWSNMYAVDPNAAGLDIYGNSGYFTGITSGTQAAFNGFAYPAAVYLSSGTFSLNSVEATAAWDKKLTIEITAFDKNGNEIYDETFKLNDKKPTLLQLDIKGAAEVDFTPLSGTQDPKLTGSGNHIVFDDFSFSKIKGSSNVNPNQVHVQNEHHTGSLTGVHADAGHISVHPDLVHPIHALA